MWECEFKGYGLLRLGVLKRVFKAKLKVDIHMTHDETKWGTKVRKLQVNKMISTTLANLLYPSQFGKIIHVKICLLMLKFQYSRDIKFKFQTIQKIKRKKNA